MYQLGTQLTNMLRAGENFGFVGWYTAAKNADSGTINSAGIFSDIGNSVRFDTNKK